MRRRSNNGMVGRRNLYISTAPWPGPLWTQELCIRPPGPARRAWRIHVYTAAGFAVCLAREQWICIDSVALHGCPAPAASAAADPSGPLHGGRLRRGPRRRQLEALPRDPVSTEHRTKKQIT
eukprot:6947526-Pyramimonas_sp.AAC.1